ncbi:MAG: tryptophan synthase subunit alpha [Thaumarchaeota archaeon]|nr:tryptophan synthase subunit alpha [Nitrososphaerota archaeon]
MSRIKSKFQDLRSKHQKALISYIMAGFPSERDTISAVRGLVKGGADIIELGMPFSDPLADGPVIQNAGFQALQKGMNLDKFLLLVKKIRMETDLPLILMTYTNILYRQGYDKFISIVKKAGIDGLILPDMSIDESKDFLQAAKKNNMDVIFLISPNTTPDRIKKISDSSSGFLYLVSVFGTTGGQQQFQNYTTHAIKNTKKILGGKIPLGVGFGVSNPDQAKFIIKSGADAIIVGSAFLRLMENTPSEKIESKIGQFTSSLKKATITE